MDLLAYSELGKHMILYIDVWSGHGEDSHAAWVGVMDLHHTQQIRPGNPGD